MRRLVAGGVTLKRSDPLFDLARVRIRWTEQKSMRQGIRNIRRGRKREAITEAHSARADFTSTPAPGQLNLCDIKSPSWREDRLGVRESTQQS